MTGFECLQRPKVSPTITAPLRKMENDISHAMCETHPFPTSCTHAPSDRLMSLVLMSKTLALVNHRTKTNLVFFFPSFFLCKNCVQKCQHDFAECLHSHQNRSRSWRMLYGYCAVRSEKSTDSTGIFSSTARKKISHRESRQKQVRRRTTTFRCCFSTDFAAGSPVAHPSARQFCHSPPASCRNRR